MAQSGSFPITKGRVPRSHLETAQITLRSCFQGSEHIDSIESELIG